MNKALAETMMIQNSYGSEKDYEMKFGLWVKKLSGRYEVSDVVKALDEYTDNHSDVPTPSDVMEILNQQSKYWSAF